MILAKFLRTPFLYRKAPVTASDYKAWCPQNPYANVKNSYKDLKNLLDCAWPLCGEL